MNHGLVGFLKSAVDVLRTTDQWVTQVGGRVPVHISLLDESIVWMLFVSEQGVDEVCHCAVD